MSKHYQTEFKTKIVKEYINGYLSYNSLGNKYNINESVVKTWVNQYRKNGIEGLQRKREKTVYSRDFKVSVLRYRQDHMLSYPETANHFNIPSHSTIARWQRDFDKDGLLGVTEKPKGRPTNMKKKQSKSPQKINETEKEELERLRIENEELRAGIAYQKKLQALTQYLENKHHKK
ncbi:helix-turn-helix domain-containing protein [Staphylococcus equorum]|uniref:Helix-turn-helix domain-containing protein n=1 Tax=Staphylococcus equorum TaxID=246432 RepID=A0A9X4LCX9_9STAP|nr:helix-turn-helix domain-containing protein [Staphylococcus equorum]MDG0844606.1 helix-turn-helix domain-containing protein [Staphylococcus equorum]MDG0860853.1 helix-turn-helix domain-containing protein [Staphylococcus equorum]